MIIGPLRRLLLLPRQVRRGCAYQERVLTRLEDMEQNNKNMQNLGYVASSL